jgi:outer membrane receptor for ferrienterochelin and colicin
MVLPAAAAAQRPDGRITGKVFDAATGAPVAGARVELPGSELRVLTAVDGRFQLHPVPAGRHDLRVTLVGFVPTRVTGIVVPAGGVVEQDVLLDAHAVELQEISVTSANAQGSVDAALDAQRNTVGIINAITSEQIARSPDGDAAAAVQRVSGATVQDGKYVSVRGLGERYTQASLNGVRIPSPEPERKVVPLDLFPSSLLSAITTSKTFTPDQPGDFSGASVDIKTREFAGRPFLSLSMSTGINDAVTGNNFGFAPLIGGDLFAMGAGGRAIPGALEGTDWSQSLDAEQRSALVGSLRNVWSVRNRSAAPNGSLSAAFGGTLPVGGNGTSYLLSASYSASQEAHLDEVRALAAPLSGGSAEELDRFEGSTARNSVTWGGIANLATSIGSHTRVTLDNTYSRTMDNEGRFETGFSENLSLPLEIQRLRYVERMVHSSRLSGQHELSRGRIGVNWGVTLSGVSRQEPDRSEIVYTRNQQGEREWLGFSNEAAVRTFAGLRENSIQLSADLQWNIGRASLVRVGGVWRDVERDADNRVYSVSLRQALPEDARSQSPEEIFASYGSNGELFRIAPLGAGGSYRADDRLTAGYLMALTPITGSIELVTGARFERSAVSVHSMSTAMQPSVAEPVFNDVLPALALTWRANADWNLRLSVTRTLSRPEYRELSPILFREVIGGDNLRGNAALSRTLVDNFDLRWEWYPGRGEVLSVALFAKQFDRPIERVYQGTSGTRIIGYVNADGAINRGIELEARTSLGRLVDALAPFTVFTNATVMNSEIRLDPAAGAMTNATRAMVGQAPYVVNAGITWHHPRTHASATLLFNRVGERIVEAGESPLPDVIEAPRSVLDASLRVPVMNGIDLRLDARNLLDARHMTTQGGVVRESYRNGRVYSLGLSWRK